MGVGHFVTRDYQVSYVMNVLYQSATNSRALLRNVTYKEKASHGCWAPCNTHPVTQGS